MGKVDELMNLVTRTSKPSSFASPKRRTGHEEGLQTPVLFLALAIGCGPKGHKEAARSEGRYTVGKPEGDWARVRPGGADLAWFHPTMGATIYFDSNCMSRYDDGELGDLITHLTFGLAQGNPVREETLTLDNRDALLRVYNGAVDGVEVRVGAVTKKICACTTDVHRLPRGL